MPICQCEYCGKETKGGRFLPGHDQRLRANLEGMVGGILNLKALVETVHDYKMSKLSCDELCQVIRKILANK